MNALTELSSLGAGLATAAVLTPVARRLAVATGAMDLPGARRVHREATPRLAGLALYGAWWVAVALARPAAAPGLLGFGLATALLVTVGAIDDVCDASPILRLALQAVAAEMAWMSGFHYPLAGTPPGVALGALATPVAHALTLLWIVGVTNAVNFMDGLDFLASGIALAATAGLAAQAVLSGSPITLYMAMAGAIMGVGIYNRFPARIFLGDCGSTFLGYFVACMACREAGALGGAALAPLVPPVLLAVPVFDTAYAVVRRLYRGVSPLTPDRGHIHHRLLEAGLSQVEAVRRIVALSLVLACLALAVGRAPLPLAALALALALALMLWVARRLSLFAATVMSSAGIPAHERPPE